MRHSNLKETRAPCSKLDWHLPWVSIGASYPSHALEQAYAWSIKSSSHIPTPHKTQCFELLHRIAGYQF